MRRMILFLVWVWGSLPLLLAQVAAEESPFMVGIGLTGQQYLGDYTEPGYFRAAAGINMTIEKVNRHPFDVTVKLGIGSFTEQFDTLLTPTSVAQTNDNFIETRYYHGELNLRFRPFVYARWQPYLAAGAGLMFFSPRNAEGELLARRTRGTNPASFNTIIPQLPASIGCMYRINQFTQLGVQYTYRFIPTDYLDNYAVEEVETGFDALHSVAVSFHISLGPMPDLPPKS